VPGSAIALAVVAAQEGWGLLNRAGAPAWLAVPAAIVALDLVVYLQHVLFHSVPALARLHAVHHADPDFDLTTGIRFHPLEILLSALIKLAAVAALGAPVVAVLAFEIVLNATAMFNHANASLPAWLEGAVRRLLVTPDMHRIHHSVADAERNSNYGFCLSLWDRLLGTYTAAPRGELDIGLPAWRDRRTIATLPGVLGMPFRHEDALHP
jgi:sterol desaturase/sphingolipid hydroxylase (fatty acid hydroxylase superfamily)